ncbi:MAG: glycosyltransferase [Nitratireductor sp.]
MKIICDGSPDDTAQAARRAIALHDNGAKRFEVVEHKVNRGKVAVLNEAIELVTSPIVVLSDASAEVDKDALMRLAAGFADPKVGVMAAFMTAMPMARQANSDIGISRTGCALAKRRWVRQSAFRVRFMPFVARPSNPFPAPPLDDFVLPMQIVARKWRAILDRRIVVRETERTRPGQEWARRIRIGAGNVQQVFLVGSLANPLSPGIAYAFISGKALRAFMPFLLVLIALAAAVLAFSSSFFAYGSGPDFCGLAFSLFSLSWRREGDHGYKRWQQRCSADIWQAALVALPG